MLECIQENCWRTDGRRTDVGWMNRHRQTVSSDHNSSLSTPCSGELKRKSCIHRCPDSVYFQALLLAIYLSAIKDVFVIEE